MMGSQGRTREQIVKAINLDRNIEETKSHDLLSKRMAGLLLNNDSLNLLVIKYSWSMLLILPNELHGLPDALTYLRQPGRLAQIIQGEFKSREVHLYLPRFKIHQGHGMNEKKKMTTLGIYDAFTPGAADFSPICGNYPLHLDQMRHKATLFIHEDGVTPGALSVFAGDPVHGIPPPDEFRFDHPFFLAIVAQDQVPVFLGHVVEPEVI
ncbi:hypothetical protein P879_00273 [Paragonimus westermani]|uniref:Serpin domain-containing protein n=1 Tax=Paragonimus westermani TaxID=34504 RepID=A0A8T0DZZ0_9TREM|nr:hypothetical protein P879_00273 [Paragonimus westermani]